MINYATLGAVVPGNLDLAHRPHVINSDGSVSTVLSFSFEEDGLEVLVPTVSHDGRIMSEPEAIRYYQQRGEHMGKYPSVDLAIAAAEAIHLDQEANPPANTLAPTDREEQRLFGRRCVVQVHDLRIDYLDVSFDVVKSLAPKTPNSAEIRIWNLSPDHRKQLQELERVYVSIDAGYEKPGLSQVFRGDLRDVVTRRENADWVTTITSDSGRRARKQRIAKSFAPGIDVAEVLRQAAQSMGVKLGNGALKTLGAKLEGTRAAQFFNGYTMAGAIGDEMDRLARSTGLEWSVQDDELQLLDRGRPLQEEGIKLTWKTGLIGSPERGNKGITEVRCLMMPGLYPGRRVLVDSAHVRGVYRIETTKHRGGRAEKDWYVDLQLKSEERAP